MFLVNGLLHGVKGHPDGDLSADSSRSLYAKAAAKFTGAFFHDGNAEMSATRQGTVGSKKSVAIVTNREAECITVVSEMNDNARTLGMANGIGHSFLTDADEMMHAAWSETDFFTLNVERGVYGSLEVIR